GVISDLDAGQAMLREFILRVHRRRRLVKPCVVVCVPSGVTMIERRAVEEAVLQAGARHVEIVSEPLAAAIGAGLPVDEPRGSMVVDVGGGTTEVAVLVLGSILASTSLRVAGDAIDAAIVSYIRKQHGVLIGERTAEKIKQNAAASCSPGAGPCSPAPTAGSRATSAWRCESTTNRCRASPAVRGSFSTASPSTRRAASSASRLGGRASPLRGPTSRRARRR